jgi:hypothetical protein
MREMNVKGASGLIVCIQSVSFLLENSGHESGNVTTQIAQLDRGLYKYSTSVQQYILFHNYSTAQK